ncbi:DUF551 domain-containing protein [Escherichia coli]|nr:DUF551 domain-containing protein [Escherichia coli]
MITITKERLLTIKQWREIYGPGSNVVLPAEEAEELARIALASLEQNVLSGNSPLIPGEVLSAIREVARIRADFDDFDGDRRGIGDCLDEAEQELIVTINKYASQLAAEPIAPNDVREQTAIPQVPVTPDGWISCSERMPNKLIPVMVMYEDGEMWSAMWNGNRWDDGTEYPDPHSVTHWREMPAAPKQEVNRG